MTQARELVFLLPQNCGPLGTQPSVSQSPWLQFMIPSEAIASALVSSELYSLLCDQPLPSARTAAEFMRWIALSYGIDKLYSSPPPFFHSQTFLRPCPTSKATVFIAIPAGKFLRGLENRHWYHDIKWGSLLFFSSFVSAECTYPHCSLNHHLGHVFLALTSLCGSTAIVPKLGLNKGSVRAKVSVHPTAKLLCQSPNLPRKALSHSLGLIPHSQPSEQVCWQLVPIILQEKIKILELVQGCRNW